MSSDTKLPPPLGGVNATAQEGGGGRIGQAPRPFCRGASRPAHRPRKGEAGSTAETSLAAAAVRLRAAGIESPRREARLLLAHALGATPEEVLAGWAAPVSAPARAAFEAMVMRRAAREPLAYIRGVKEFWSLPIAVTPDVLIPRPESETLVEEALRRFPERQSRLRVLDLGTGSGCLLLAFLSERPHAVGVGADISEPALKTARRNAAALNLSARAQFVLSDWFENLSGTYDVVFANPPYIAREELAGLEPEVAGFEPPLALDGGPDGLSAYRRLARGLKQHLSGNGVAFVETGFGQANAVHAIFANAGLKGEGTVCDLAGISRCVVVA